MFSITLADPSSTGSFDQSRRERFAPRVQRDNLALAFVEAEAALELVELRDINQTIMLDQ
ncbi:MAG: hypothetical protein O2960_05280 [Verrucomicrobia bacterium]|nr:hypothetical protein [Verrucomicrobiota bacterium]